MPILQAIVDGKTIQHKTINREWYDTNVASLDHLVTYYNDYRIKPEQKYRPFKDEEECWQEMQKHQPFGWVVGRRDGVMYLIRCLEYVSVYTSIQYSFKDAFDKFAFADLIPFGVKVEE